MKPAALLALLLLSACQKAEYNDPPVPIVRIDTQTGCEYIGWNSNQLTPRIAENGKSHRGCKTPLLEK